jgi:hypothetical protein
MSSILSGITLVVFDDSVGSENVGDEIQADSPPKHTWPDEFPYRLPEGAASVCRGMMPSVVHLLSDEVPKHAMGMSVYDQ